MGVLRTGDPRGGDVLNGADPVGICAVRIGRTKEELGLLWAQHRAWISSQREKPEANRYRTQIDVIDTVLQSGVEQLSIGLESVSSLSSEIAVYEACRTFDLRILWLRRVWQFFREKFDQRDTHMAEALRAADEVVWSCYAHIFRQTRHLTSSPQAVVPPLPFVESKYSPAAFPADLVPAGLQSEIDRPFLRQHLNRLPVPVVRLPPACVSGPWWLVYVGHEIGHNIQYDLMEHAALVDAYRDLVQRAVRVSGGTAGAENRWGEWSREIFADIFSVLIMGAWAVWAMVELEFQSDKAMMVRREQYPSAVVRLELLAATADAMGLDGRAALRGLRPKQIAAHSAATIEDLSFVDAVVRASLGTLPGISVPLARLCNFRLPDYQPVDRRPSRIDEIRMALVADRMPILVPSAPGPRLAVCASLAAWSDLSRTADAATLSGLRDRSLRLINASGPPGTRVSAARIDARNSAAELARSLLTADRQDLEV